jgi:outer membrane protein assembly factor BamB
VVFGDQCIINFGPGERSFLVALNKRTGKELWRTATPAPTTMEGSGAQQGYVGSWSTPVIMKTGGRTDLVVSLPGDLRGFDPQSGTEVWHCDGLNPLAYANPLLADGVMVAMGGFGGYAIGVKAGGTGDLTAQDRLWQEKKSAQRIGSGVVKDGMIYMTNATGVVQCIEPKTGHILWQERIQTGPKQSASWSSLILSGDRLYLPTQASDTVVLKADPKFEQLGVNSLDDGLMNASLAVSDGEIFIRTHKNLWCIGGK